MSSIEKVFNFLGAALRIHFELLSWEMIESARVSFIVVQTLLESTRTPASVFPNTTGRLIDSIGVVGSAENADATQFSSLDE